MEQVGPDGENSPFSRSNDPWSRASWHSRSKQPILKVKRYPDQTLPMELVGPDGENDPFSRSNDPWSR
ncbi:hypothetical protein KY289_031908 [Solanum tuberosum]|nr:hypothetical protein KY289_031908 [Solanum tuberosum]